MAEIIRNGANWSIILQALIIAAITAATTGYVSARVLESKVDYLASALAKNDEMDREFRRKLDEIALRQASTIGNANAIHDHQNGRLDRLEGRR